MQKFFQYRKSRPALRAGRALYLIIYTQNSKTQRYEQDKARADLLQGVYTEVHNQNKTQTQRRIAKYI